MEKNVIELTIDDLDFSNVQAIAIVDYPAIEENFHRFSKSKTNYTFAKINQETMEICGPAMIPDKEIYRYNFWTGEEYYVKFSDKTIKDCSQLFLQQFRQNNININHEINANNITIVESWLVGDNDKSETFGYKLPKGTWMVTMKIQNPTVIDMIKNGELKGFSIEGYFVDGFTNENDEEEFCNLVNKLSSLKNVNLEPFKELFNKEFEQK